VPRDCTPEVRRATSVWRQLQPEVAGSALDRLHADLESGAWEERHGHLRDTPELDAGLRLIAAEL